jgi:hypothetical protein
MKDGLRKESVFNLLTLHLLCGFRVELLEELLVIYALSYFTIFIFVNKITCVHPKRPKVPTINRIIGFRRYDITSKPSLISNIYFLPAARIRQKQQSRKKNKKKILPKGSILRG